MNAKWLTGAAVICFVALFVVTGLAIYGDWVSSDTVRQPAEAPTEHTVQDGDTWESLAELFGVGVEELEQANPDASLAAGVTIKVPSREERITVKAGESLKSIAHDHHIPVARLRAYNALPDDAVLEVGQSLVVPPRDPVKDRIALWALLYATLFVVALWLTISAWQKGTGKSIRDIVRGDAGRYSISKLQMLLWTGCFVFTYMVVMVGRVLNGESFVTEIPEALLALMGISIATFSSAKAIVQGKQPALQPGADTSQEAMPSGATTSKGAADLTQDSAGNTDVSRVQLLAWTIIGVVLYLFQVLSALRATNGVGLTIPDVDGTILALTIASSGGYLTKQLVWLKRKSPVIRAELAAGDDGSKQHLFLYSPNFGEYTSDPSKNKIEIRRAALPEAEWAVFGHRVAPYNDPAQDWTPTLLRGQAVKKEDPLECLQFEAGEYIHVKVRLAGVDYPETVLKVFAR